MIEFPCEFPIKIIYKNEPGARGELMAILHRHYPDLSTEAVKLQPSKDGNFISMTARVIARDQESLNLLYYELTRHPLIKMVL